MSPSPTPTSLSAILSALHRYYGPPRPPFVTDPWEMILFENAAYLVDDDRRETVFLALKKKIGLRPDQILDAAPTDLIAAIKDGGMQPPMRAEKLRRASRISLDFFGGDLKPLLKLPLHKLRRALKRFPGIGDPGADKILLFARIHPVLALDSNGLRALLRLGYGEDSGSYAAGYRSAQESIADQLPRGFDLLIQAHQLLRLHAQTLCRRTGPLCSECPLRKKCPVGISQSDPAQVSAAPPSE